MSDDLFEIPENWVWTKMVDVADVIGGATPKTSDPANFQGGTIPWLTPADLSRYTAKYIGSGSRFITQKGLASSSARMMPVGTVLFTSRAPIGYVVIANKEICTNQGFKSFVLKSKDINPDYIYWWLKGNKDLAESLASGTTFLELSGEKAKQIPFPLAPLNEQTRIVAEIEKQFSRLDEAVANLKRVKANLKRYKAAVLKAAIEGKLTEEWRRQHPDVESAGKLLERILAARRKAAGKGKYKEPVGPDTSGLPGLPEGWIWANLGQLSSKLTSGSRDWSPYYGRGNAIFVLAQNVRPMVPDFSVMQLVDPPEDDPSCARSLIQPRDLLITIVGANTGHVCVVAETPGKAFVCQSVALVRPVISESAEYINIWLNSEEHGQKYFENCMYGQGRPHLSFDQLGATPIALPPLLELPRIVAEAERQLSVISGIEAQVDHISRRADRLRQSILKRAFSGRLVHHDPNDEPASALLERVRVNANVGATRQVAQKPMTKGRRGTVSPLRETNLAPAFPDDFTSLDSILAAILNRMQPGRQYSRTEIADALGLSTGKWNAAIQELKRRCKVLQVGERRGAKYSRVDQNVNKGDGF